MIWIVEVTVELVSLRRLTATAEFVLPSAVELPNFQGSGASRTCHSIRGLGECAPPTPQLLGAAEAFFLGSA